MVPARLLILFLYAKQEEEKEEEDAEAKEKDYEDELLFLVLVRAGALPVFPQYLLACDFPALLCARLDGHRGGYGVVSTTASMTSNSTLVTSVRPRRRLSMFYRVCGGDSWCLGTHSQCTVAQIVVPVQVCTHLRHTVEQLVVPGQVRTHLHHTVERIVVPVDVRTHLQHTVVQFVSLWMCAVPLERIRDAQWRRLQLYTVAFLIFGCVEFIPVAV